jgi:hypothetical protein
MRERRHTVAVAELDGSLIGMGWLVIFERAPNIRDARRRIGNVQSVFVDEGHRCRRNRAPVD